MKKTIDTPQENIVVLWVLIVLSTVILLLPFFFVSFPPSTDLPQHLGQIYLLKETLRGNTDLLTINWYAPNNLVYLLLAASTFALPPPLSGKMAVLLLVFVWIGSVFFLAWYRQRPSESALMAVLFSYNPSFYWGFLNFLVGWPFFVLWLTQSLKPVTKKRWFLLLLLSLCLYGSHALWFLLGSIWLLLSALFHQRDWKSLAYRMSAVVPTGILAIVWYSALPSTREVAGFDTAPHWFRLPYERLSPSYLINTMLGGVKGYMEPIVGLAILGWILLSLYSVYANRRRLKKKVDRPLLLCALLFIFIMVFAPEQYMNTIYFSQRWFPCAVILLLLALPIPAANRNLLRAFALCILVLFSVGTTRAWHTFQQKELSGLRESLDALPENQRVLGLDFVKTSDVLKGRPFLQIFAYAQVFKGGDLNFSFAEHSSGIVQYRNPKRYAWTPSLEWLAEQVKVRDFQYFDYVLANGEEEAHSRLLAQPFLEPVSGVRKWRLYRIVR